MSAVPVQRAAEGRSTVVAAGAAAPGEAWRMRFGGALAGLSAADRRALVARAAPGGEPDADAIRDVVATIVARVRRDGDPALRALARDLDGVELDQLEVPAAVARAAIDRVDPALRRALERSARNLARAHRAFRPRAARVVTEPGVRVTRRPDPLARVGVYAPGGRAAYASSVLMAAVPARIAGVGEIVLCSPPGPDGLPATPVLAAAALAGVDRVFAIGGAGAIAALAYGTASVPGVDRIAGPGNAWVAEAKLQVSRVVGIDAPAGPSELLAIADGSADPARVALELVAQAEHDPSAVALALAIGPEVAAAITCELTRLLAGDAAAPGAVRPPRSADAAAPGAAPSSRTAAEDPGAGRFATRGVARAAVAARGGVLAVRDLDEALAFAAEFAPEHLLLAIADPAPAAARTRNAGAVFLGLDSSVAFGDYLTGSNHVLPTGGWARTGSGLSVSDFVRWTSLQHVTAGAAARLANDVASFAESERLPAHAAAARAAGAGTHTLDSVARAEPRRRTANLADNTNAWGAPPAARAAARAARRSISRYPAPDALALRAAIARRHGVTPGAVVAGCGSDDVLDGIFRALAAPGDRIAFADPTFSMVPAFARANRLVPVAVPLRADFDADAGAVIAADARLVYLCAPNNPTGTTVSPAALARVVAAARGVVVLDRAYADFDDDGLEASLGGGAPVLRVHTFSKAWGLAGLRVGYAVGPPELVARVAETLGPYRVNAIAERAALAALGSPGDARWVAARVARVRRRRAAFARALARRGFAPLPSRANFVLVPVRDAAAAAERMAARGVEVRAFQRLTGIGDAVRVTIGRMADLRAALAALEPAREQGGDAPGPARERFGAASHVPCEAEERPCA